jgi:hypothetical protein
VWVCVVYWSSLRFNSLLNTKLCSSPAHFRKKKIDTNTFPVDIASSPNCFHFDSLCASIAISCKATRIQGAAVRLRRISWTMCPKQLRDKWYNTIIALCLCNFEASKLHSQIKSVIRVSGYIKGFLQHATRFKEMCHTASQK